MKASDARSALSLLPLLASVLLILFSVHADSLWMDEIQTHTVIQGTFSDLLREPLVRDDFTGTEMPERTSVVA